VAITGRTGADAVYIAVKHICTVLNKYRSKFEAVVVAAQGAGAISSAEATYITNFLSVADALCVALLHLSEYSGF
jgi:hypothetical protein